MTLGFTTHPAEAIAVICGGDSLTYGELDRRSSNLAGQLTPHTRIALCATRSTGTIVALFAILKAGAAYIPLDPDYPADLLAFMVADSGASLLLAPRSHLEMPPASSLQTVCFEDEAVTPAVALPSIASDRLAYIIYTSGSTGRPKGVLISHANLAHSTDARLKFYGNPPARFLLLSSFAFDSSIAGIFWTLVSGGTLVIPESGEARDPSAIAALIAAQKVTHTLCLPALHALLLGNATDLRSLKTIIVAGENCPPDLPAAHFRRIPHARLFNEYGPTEATVWSTVAELKTGAPITIGKAIPGTTIQLIEGEIHIGGPGVASGYLNQPALTSERFISRNGEHLYKTGDLARELPNGDLEFLGRSDRQVKIRGHRIELDAIESVLLSHPKISTAAVLSREGRLVAYVPSIPSDLRSFLAEKLPPYMQPSAIVALATFPLAPNGKIDRNALPSPGRTRPALDTEFATPRTALETFLTDEWRDVLQLDQVGIHDRFFDLGGDSLQAAILANRLQQKLGEPVFIVAIFTAPTIAQLAEFLKGNYPLAVARIFGEIIAPTAIHGQSIVERVRAILPKRQNTIHPLSRKNPRAIFILAPPRSGTTLLRAMLAGHPALFTASELRLLGFDTLAERRAAYSGPQSLWYRGIISALAEIKNGDEAEAVRIAEECEQENFSTAEFFTLLQQSIAPRELVDKSPSYALDPATLHHTEEIFDNAFFIHLTRHPTEMIRSFAERRMDQVYLPASDLTPREAGEAVWQIAHQNILDFLATIPAERQAHIRFTDLVHDPRSTMTRLCEALGIPFDEAVLDPYKDAPASESAGIQTFDDPHFRQRRSIDSNAASISANDESLSESTRALAGKLGYENPSIPSVPSPEAIAIIGLAGRFPGASDIETFWKNLCTGTESIRPFTKDELRASGIDPAILSQSDYVNAGAVPENADQFAASFFGYTPREAELMDPQQRLFLEVAWEAFEHAGCDVSRFAGSVGVFAGLALNSYFQNNLATRPDIAPLLGHYSLTIGNEKDFVATRVAHKLGLHGPAIGVQTACSSSLVAVHLACQSLRLREIDLALVGGGRVRAPLHAGYTYVDGGIPSPDGHCRAFDAEARGCVAASGVAAVVLKRVADAQRDGDHIFAVIKATAINNDGGDKAGFTAPSVEGQAEVIARAHAAAGITADTISYIETHGTGTTLGDPIEIAALTKAFRKTSSATAHCRIGSVKTNIGHLDAGAGVAGLIKTALALDRGLIPPSLHFQNPNPQIEFTDSPFIVNAAQTEWQRAANPRRAGVSSFGIGGTNAHAILEDSPSSLPSLPSLQPQLLILSARTLTALDRATANLAQHLRANPGQSLADIAFTLQTGRRQFQHRRVVVASSAVEAADLLESRDSRRVFTTESTSENSPVAFMFPGQGAQHPGMARELFENEPIFRDALNRCSEILRPHLDLLAALYPAEPASETMTATAIAQPAIFSIEYALAKLWESHGVKPSVMLGHSVGEFVAATLAGVFTLEDALTLLAGRARLMQAIPAGAMLAVRLPESELRPRLGTLIEIAAINSPRLCVVSGPPEAIQLFAEEMAAESIATVPLQTSHAFHSAMMEPVIAPFTELVKNTRLNLPRIPLVSTLTGDTSADFTAPEYWANQLRQPVRFSTAAANVDKNHILLEVGPGTTLAPLARQSRGGTVVSSLNNSGTDQSAMLEALGRLWLAGVAIDWSLQHAGERRSRVQLPTYPFERERYWLEPGTRSLAAAPVANKEPTVSEKPLAPKPDTDLHDEIKAVLHELSGVPVERMSHTASFLEIGFDSLFLTQAILAIRKRFGVTVAFRQLFEEFSTIDALAAFIGKSGTSDPSVASVPFPKNTPAPTPAANKSFGPFRPLNSSDTTALTPRQQTHIDALAARYSERTRASKELTQKNRKHLADPRSISGFRPFWKELIYPTVVESSSGSKMRDIDGHEYIDFTMGYGTNLLGHSPRFITDAIAEQLDRGMEIGPQSPLAGEVAALLCEFSGHDRAAFCNTGSEAVVAAVRVARTVTGRDRIATCSGYHGINDEFLVRAKIIGGERRSVAIAPGIPDHVAREVLAAEYGSPESLEIIRAHAHELAAILVEPVQSRHPDLQPREFLHELRKITREAGIALVFDEVITGFRCHPGGAQTWFGVRADLVTYGKIIGGGMPIGALCGRAEYMDALDGGAWNFGDDSRPETGVTFFAGTYVRHPLAMAASRAMLRHLRDKGPALQKRLNERTAQLVADLNSFLAVETVPIRVEVFGSMFIVKFDADFAFGGLLFFHLREKGIHAWDNRLLFLSTAHTEEDLARFNTAFCESVAEMRAGGFFEKAIQTTIGREAAPRVPKLPMRAEGAGGAEQSGNPQRGFPTTGALQFSLYFFGNYPAAPRADKYDLVIESTRFADQHGFTAVWLPERHFHSVGGFSPNAAVMAAALARETTHIQLRAGSVVLPLHHPVRVAEEWSLVDNLSKGRVGISIASGWHPHDFVFAPDAYENRRELCTQSLETIRQLWRGDAINAPSGAGDHIDVRLFPMPVQRELPVWLTCVQAESYERAGELGLNILAQLQNQSLDDIAEKIGRYREARSRAGYDRGHVTILLHTFVTENIAQARTQARSPLRDYLRSHVEISQRKLSSQNGAAEVSTDDLDFLLDRAADDYARGKAFIGTPESCIEIAEQLRAIGVDEVGCLIDFGIDPKAVLASLPHLDRLRQHFAKAPTTLPLLPAQRGLTLLTSTIPEASRAYNETSALELRGPLDLTNLRAALQAIVDRHEALRTTIDAEKETQTIHSHATLQLIVSDDLARTIAEVRALTFDFTRAPLMDARLCRHDANHHVLLLTFHHVFGNGPSYVAFFDDLCTLLAETPGQPPPVIQLSDYIHSHSSRSETDAEAFWKKQFADCAPTLDLPLDHPRPAETSYRGARETMFIGNDLLSALRSTGAKLGGSLFMTLLSAFQTLLHRLSGQDDLVVAVPFSDTIRQQPGGDRLFANTTNIAPLRSRIADTITFPELIAANRALVLEATEHQHYFFGDLLDALHFPFDASHSPLFSVLFNYESGTYRREIGNLTLELITDRGPWLGLRDTAIFEMYLNVAERPDGLFFRCDYNSDLFDGTTIQRWLGHLRTLLEAIVAEPVRPIAKLPLFTANERTQLLTGWNQTARDFPREKTLHQLVEETARQQPDACAIVDHATRLTYSDLDSSANRVARRLQSLGAKPGTFVGVCMERTSDLIVALLGILKSGAACVPLDANAPRERIAEMLADAVPLAVLCDADTAHLPGTSWQTVSSAKYESAGPVTSTATPHDLAYLIYTSGSTGKPKGVAIEHHSAVNFVHWAGQTFSADELAGVLAATSICFDLSIFEIFAPLSAGGSIILAKNVLELPALPNAYEVTLVNTVPSAMTELVRANELPAGVQTVFLAGEPLSESLVCELHESGVQRVCDGYGPTETGYATFAERKSGEPTTIGRAIANARAYVLDAHMQPVPVGVMGEIFIGGEGVARGYWKRDELTAQRFLASPFVENERLYKTGDLAHWNADGQLVYRGRSDHQVKMRGYRVELGEIESLLRQHPGIAETVVIAHAAGTPDARLVAYFVPIELPPSAAELRTHLKVKLPDYMLPGAFMPLERLPLTPNGKLDRRALPEPEPMRSDADAEFVAPRDATENRVAEVWQQVLKLPRVSIHDDFFTIGGHSLTAMQVVARLRGAVLPGLNLHHMFAQPTIAGLIGAVRQPGCAEAREEGVL